MKTYMDKEVLVDFMKDQPGTQSEEDLQHNWICLKKFLRRQTELILNVNLDREGGDPLSEFITVLKTFGYAGTSIKCDSSKFRFKNKTDFQKEFTNTDNLFFINEIETGQLQKWKARNGYFIAGGGELMEAWRKLNLTYGYPKSLPVRDFDIPDNLKSWKDLLKYQHPVTDIIISDRFLLKEKSLIEANLIPLLSTLVANRVAHFNLTLFTAKNEVYEKDINKAKADLEKLLSDAKITCNLVLVYDTIERFKEHDRHIITNYYYFYSGDTFTYFKKDGTLKTNGTALDIKPLVDKDHLNVACAVLKNLKRSFTHPNIEKTTGQTSRLFSLVSE